MPSLNIDLDYFDHPKTKRLVGLLGKGTEALPLRLWCYVGKHFADTGRLTGHSTQEIESIVDWRGRTGAFEQALLAVGFALRDGADLVIHDWLDHEGHLAAYRLRGKKAAAARWGRVSEVIRPSKSRDAPHLDATSMLQACLKHTSSNAIAEQNRAEQTVAAQPATTPSSRTRDSTARAPRGTRKLTDDQERIRQEFGDWWISAEYPRRHEGLVYEFEGGRDASAVLKIMRSREISWDIEKAKALARFFFDQPEVNAGSHQLYTLGINPGYWIRKMRERAKGANHVIGRARPTAEQRGQFASDTSFPILRASAG